MADITFHFSATEVDPLLIVFSGIVKRSDEDVIEYVDSESYWISGMDDLESAYKKWQESITDDGLKLYQVKVLFVPNAKKRP